MEFSSIREALQMNTTDTRHLKKTIKSSDQNTEQSFAEFFFKAIEKTNKDQHNADDLQQAAILSPDTVNVADIMIATEKARLSVGMLKAITERAARAYTEILNIR